ncbi:DUF1194 domain-containing protein [Aquabacter cavernae]|uniref:DUF1194 domain-containing protein n=1 Tax=Aquabacter cavernae TaxID=2496029 RepID=UPI000F8C4132|nr:DUF1194 domain-containing protein [Aquabacter cavernae]
MAQWRSGVAALLAALLLPLLAGIPPAQAAPRANESNRAGNTVDVQLVLAVDISYSMDPDEQALQREGYAAALISREFLDALKLGPNGRIAVTYLEWAGELEQRVIIPWTVVDGADTARALSDRILAVPLRRAYRTSISGALQFSMGQFQGSGYRALRNVIDISGDGVNNQGPPVTQVRDEVVKRGITINGLPLVLKRSSNSAMDVPDLDIYYEDCVIGGAGAFVIPVRAMDEFARAIKTKLVLEVAGVKPKPQPRIVPAADPSRVSCTIGERMWQEHWNN